jgi:hypothetical protein
MALPLTETDKFLLLSAVGAPETRDRISALLDLAGTGNMTGPASATDNALVRFDGATGALVQNSGALLDDSNNLSGLGSISASSANLSGLTASRALQTDGSKNLQSSSVTTTELGFLSGVTSAIQTQLNSKAPTSNPVFTGQIQGVNGSAGVPSYSFSSDTNTGIYSVLADRMMLVAGATDNLQIDGTLGVSVITKLNIPDGTAAVPSLSFNSDADTGAYRSAADQYGIAAAGAQVANFTSSGCSLTGALSATTYLETTSNADPGAPVNAIRIGSKESTDGTPAHTVHLRTEQAVEAIGTFTESHKLRVWINNVEYWISLDAV